MTTPKQEAMADRDGWIWFDGKLIRWRDAQVHVLTHALHYGSAVFEGQRAYGGTIFALSDHSERLRASARLLGFQVPWSADQIDAACNEVLTANQLTDAYMRPVSWCGAETMGIVPADAPAHLAIAAFPWDRYFDAAAAERGISLNISRWRRPAPYTAPSGAKASGLYMICALAKRHAAQAGFDDALMLDWRGQIAEASAANIFFVRDGALHTPLPDCFLDGITRRTVITLARRRGIEVVERAIWPEEMDQFSEVFVTGTAVEVTPVRSIGPWTFNVGFLTRQLMRDYSDLVHGRLSASGFADAA